MRFCDITLCYTDTSGGVRTYVEAKREHLLRCTPHEHVLVVPGEQDRVERSERQTVYRVASPPLPGCEPYRVFVRPDKIKRILEEASPDAIELGSCYVAPWPSFSYRHDQAARGRRCAVGGYFHSDIADAYFGQPVRGLFEGRSEWLEWLGAHLADAAQFGAEAFLRSVFDRCDLRLAASPRQAERLQQYGVEAVQVVPLGVDADRFHPRRRSERLRESLGATESDIVMVYAGRLDSEKQPDVLVDAFEQLPASLNARLVLIGEGPLRDQIERRASQNERLHLLPYEDDAARLAELLASSDIYVTAGPHETFGLSVVEAQASGLPVVGVCSGALVERVPDGLGKLGPVGDADAFALNLRSVAAARWKLGAAARRHVEREFSWDASLERLISLYVHTFESGPKLSRSAGKPAGAVSD